MMQFSSEALKKYAIAIAVALAITAALSMIPTNPGTTAKAIATPEYPDKIRFDDYDERRNRSEDIDPAFLSSLSDFAFASSSLVLSEKTDKNKLYSPVSLYMALALAAESANGRTRDEIVHALSMPNMAIINQQTAKLFRSLHKHNEIGRLTIANSLWLDETVEFKPSFLQSAAANYYAHSYKADFTSPDTPELISNWLMENTGGKLGSGPQEIGENQIMALMNTIYFYDEWTTRFDANKTAQDIFHLANGSTVTSNFMNITFGSHSFVRRDGYTVSGLGFKNGQSMLFILPDEGLSPEFILSNPTLLNDAVTALSSDDRQAGQVIFQIPKFNFSSDLNLRSILQKLGISLAFDMENADFSNLADTKPLFISGVKQSVTISIDEIGCEAAAFTKIDYAGAAPPDGRAEMILNKPFIFAVTGTAEVPLFIGVINNPQN
ncbi:MAG: serpin family protein [Bacillota bacterium]|nr:serpin family protein [Bacillota bacterium]MDW7682739.1 serpin family protein [Bacillota bacterium]